MASQTIINEIERVPTHLTKCLDLLERWEERISTVLDSHVEGHVPKAPLAKQLSDISKVSVAMAKELRAWVGKVTEVVDKLTLPEQADISINFLQKLSVGDRVKAYQSLRERESERDGGIKLWVGER